MAGRGVRVRAADDVIELRSCRDDDTDRIDVRLREDVVPPRPRAFLTSSACGVCSADLIDLDLLVHRGAVVARLPRERGGAGRTAGRHAGDSSGCSPEPEASTRRRTARADGTVLAVREDIGRHNAVDKIVGWALLSGRLPLTDHLIVVSGRVSFEIVQKIGRGGCRRHHRGVRSVEPGRRSVPNPRPAACRAGTQRTPEPVRRRRARAVTVA